MGLISTVLCSGAASPRDSGGQTESTAAARSAASSVTMTSAESPEPPRNIRVWRVSVLTFVAANAFDYASSAALRGTPGLHEANVLEANANGQYALGRGAAFKIGATCAVVVPEYLLIRKYPKMAKLFSYINFGSSAAPIWAGSHNLSLMHR